MSAETFRLVIAPFLCGVALGLLILAVVVQGGIPGFVRCCWRVFWHRFLGVPEKREGQGVGSPINVLTDIESDSGGKA